MAFSFSQTAKSFGGLERNKQGGCEVDAGTEMGKTEKKVALCCSEGRAT